MSFHRVPLGLKAAKPIRGTSASRAHMARVAQLACVCCGAMPVSVHHCISGRFSQAKASDFDVIPLCHHHHQGAAGIHAGKATWEALWGADTDYLAVVADMLAGEYVSPWGRP